MLDGRLPLLADLCRRALDAEGETRWRALAALQEELDRLASGQPQYAVAEKPAHVRVLEQLAVPIVTMDLTGYITGWNRSAETLFGYTEAEAIGQHILFLYADDDGSGEINELSADAGESLMEVRRRKKSGEVFWAKLALSMLRDESGEPLGLVAHISEVTERLSATDKFRLHSKIIEDSDQGIMITDADQRIVSVNAAFCRITGYTAAEAIGQTPDLLRSGAHDTGFRGDVQAAMRGVGPWQGEIIGRRKNGELFPQSVSISVVRNDKGELTHAFSIFTDISAQKDTEERIQRLANYDEVTGLPNRSLLEQLIGQALASARRTHAYGALLVIALDRFNAINDALGHEVGNELICEVSRRFRRTLRDEDVLARVGGGEFAAALLNIQKREHAGVVARKLAETLESPLSVRGEEFHLGVHIGISVFPDDGLETAVLSRAAHIAMARAQQSGDSLHMFYCDEMNQRAKEHLKIESELRQALAGRQLLLYYQPKVSLRSGQIVGAEALIRWKHPDQGMVPPGRFIPVAEESGLIMNLGTWVLEESCRQIKRWQAEDVTVPPIAINLSARQFDQQLPGRIQAILDYHEVAPERIRLEITESLLVRGAETVIPIMNQLVAMGLALALDDFGTGYSSLAYLKKFPISTLKIDRSFVIGLPHEENDRAIAQAIVALAQQLRQEIVAEGVETPEQMDFLRNLGCDQLQGYLFSPPVHADDFERMVREGRRLALER